MEANEEPLSPKVSQGLRIPAMVLELNDVSVARQMVQGLCDGEVVDWIHLEQYARADMLPAHGAVEASAHEAINVALTRSRGNASKPALRGPEDSAKP